VRWQGLVLSFAAVPVPAIAPLVDRLAPVLREALASPPTTVELDLHPRPELDHRVVRQAEELHDAAGIARHRGEQALAPVRHAVAARGHHVSRLMK
jgi:hypothetical protein